MAWSQAHYDMAIASGLPSNTAAHIASQKRPTRAFHNNYSRHMAAVEAQPVQPQSAPPPPAAPIPVQAPEAVLLRPETNTRVQRRRSRRDKLGLTNRGVSQFSFSPSAGLGGFGAGGEGSGLGI